MTETKIIFFDLDGTLRETKSGKTFINEPEDQQAIAGTQKALQYYSSKGFTCIGITNQGGVAAGHKSLQSAIEEQWITLQLFPELSEIFFCTTYEGECCYQISQTKKEALLLAAPIHKDVSVSCRKPNYGMLLLAAKGNIWKNCFMIGDRAEDQQCAEAAGVNFIWASVMHAKFGDTGMHEIECKHINPDVLAQFLKI
jgi:D-glycero-D-manno-heptose 1,7-bisphosphate phosphatase